jgi:hypothetical protein
MNDPFEEYLGEPIKLKIDGKEFELDIWLTDKHKIISAQGGKKEITDDALDKMDRAIANIFYRNYLPHIEIKSKENGGTYPYWKPKKDITEEETKELEKKKKQIDAFMLQNSEIVLNELGSVFGWDKIKLPSDSEQTTKETVDNE